ncbi:MAG: hypothetical protein KBS52_04660 [Clostridiales bacterium]|nr:hypothetical protein [Candidatus Equinaster intestinalis]
MLGKFLRIAAMLVAVCILLCGCSFVGGDTDSLLSPPRPSGELYNIQQALNSYVSEKYTLKYPVSGDYRSAIINKDLNSDGTDEAVAFYSTVKDGAVTMHILLIEKNEEKWAVSGEFKCVATGVESVQFKDMDADGKMEILVGWSVYGNLEKTLGVYSIQKGSFLQRISESYNDFVCSDLTGDGKSEIFLVNLDSKESAAVAKLISLTDNGTQLLGSVPLDPSITAYSSPVVSRLPNGNTAVYVDAIKGAGVITEVLEIKNGGMVNALVNENLEMADTFRSSAAAVRDIDADGVCEIPMMTLITQAPDSNDNVYRTDWCVIEGGNLKAKMSAFMNYGDGYFVQIPEKWEGKVTVIRDTANRIRTILKIDEATGNSGEVLVKIQALPVTENSAPDAAAIPGAAEIGRTGELYYLASCTGQGGEQAVTFEEFRNYFKILGK